MYRTVLCCTALFCTGQSRWLHAVWCCAGVPCALPLAPAGCTSVLQPALLCFAVLYRAVSYRTAMHCTASYPHAQAVLQCAVAAGQRLPRGAVFQPRTLTPVQASGGFGCPLSACLFPTAAWCPPAQLLAPGELQMEIRYVLSTAAAKSLMSGPLCLFDCFKPSHVSDPKPASQRSRTA